jgi:starvation-inducible DNA-binding protein
MDRKLTGTAPGGNGSRLGKTGLDCPSRVILKENQPMAKDVKARKSAALATPTDLGANATKDLTGGLNILLADVYALYIKTKNFHWHMSGPHFRDFHLLLGEQADQLLAMTDPIAERVRKIGGTTLRGTGHILKLQRLLDNDADFVSPHAMLAELREDNIQLSSYMRETHALCEEMRDVATASLIEQWIDDAERRTWFLFESGRGVEG